MKSLSSVQGAAVNSSPAKDGREKIPASGDYRIMHISRITGLSYCTCSGLTFHGQYFVGKTRLVRKEVFDYKRKTGQGVAV